MKGKFMAKTDNGTSMYLDFETNDRLEALAAQTGRTKIETMRRLLDNNLSLLPGFETAILHQVAADQGLDSLIEATSLIIRDWVKMKPILIADSVVI